MLCLICTRLRHWEDKLCGNETRCLAMDAFCYTKRYRPHIVKVLISRSYILKKSRNNDWLSRLVQRNSGLFLRSAYNYKASLTTIWWTLGRSHFPMSCKRLSHCRYIYPPLMKRKIEVMPRCFVCFVFGFFS